MLNGNGNKSSKKINMLCCFFLSRSPSGHAGSKCDIWHWFTCKGWMYARASYTLTWWPKFLGSIDYNFFNPWCSATCALRTRELHYFDYYRKEAPSHTSSLEKGKIWCTLGESFDKQTLICFKNVVPVQLIHWMIWLPSAKERDTYTCISKTNLFGSWHFTTCSSTSCPSNLW